MYIYILYYIDIKDHVSHHSAEVRCQLGDVAFQAALGAPCVAAASLGQVQLGTNFSGDSECQNGGGRMVLPRSFGENLRGKTGKHTLEITEPTKTGHHIHEALFGAAF